MSEQRLLKGPGPLLDSNGQLADIGWSRQPLLDCNLENAHFYNLRFMQKFRIKRWDYYAVTTPTHFFSFTISDIGYMGNIFAYVINFETKHYHEESVMIPPSNKVHLPRNSQEGESSFTNNKVDMHFQTLPGERKIQCRWDGFEGKALNADFTLTLPADHESMNIVIPIEQKRFYFNRKVNCMPATGWVEYGGERFDLTPQNTHANLDWGRGVWAYNSFWVWASTSGFLADGRRVGLNMGYGFGDTSAATENALTLDGRLHKFGRLDFKYTSGKFMEPWKMISEDGRLNMEFTPFLERVAKTDLKVLQSEVHQMFGKYNGTAVTDQGETIQIRDLTGFAEEHHAKW